LVVRRPTGLLDIRSGKNHVPQASGKGLISTTASLACLPIDVPVSETLQVQRAFRRSHNFPEDGGSQQNFRLPLLNLSR
jgi:hypothetical protein